jgi:tetratricopeptide (TPR) repeat protein
MLIIYLCLILKTMRTGIFIFAIFLALFACDSSTVKIQRFLLIGNQHLENQEFESAIYYYKEAIALDSCFSDALNNLGTAAYKVENWPEAIDWYNRAIDCNPRPEYFINRSNAAYEIHAYYQALEDVSRYLEFKPDTLPGLLLQALTLTKLGRYPEALSSINQAIKKDSLNSDLLINRATLFYFMRDYAHARPDLNRVLNLDSLSGEAWNALAMINTEEGNLDMALDLIQRALNTDPKHPHFLNNRGYIYLLSGEKSKAEQDINASMILDPENPWVYRNRGIIYFKAGKWRDAERLLAQSLSMDSLVGQAAYYYALTELELGETTKGCAWLKKAIGGIPAAQKNVCR